MHAWGDCHLLNQTRCDVAWNLFGMKAGLNRFHVERRRSLIVTPPCGESDSACCRESRKRELLSAAPTPDFRGVDVSFRVDRQVVQRLELSRVAAGPSKRGDSLEGLAIQDDNLGIS